MTVTLHQEGLRHLLRDPLGPTGRYIDAKARAVDFQAHLNTAGGGPGPGVRVGAGHGTGLGASLHDSIRYGGLEFDGDGLVAYIITDAFSPRQHFPYPLAMELGMPSRAGMLPKGQRPYGPFPFLEPALRSQFPGAV